ncbi:4598_t:CDS:1, partial [Funneliformis caledonium]
YCKNTSCKAYNQLQIVRHFGYGTYKFPTEPHLSICKLCKKQVEPVTCGFTNTLWKYEWKKSVDLNAWRMEGTTERTITEKSTTWERAELDEYVTFGNASISEDVGVQWLKLKITT